MGGGNIYMGAEMGEQGGGIPNMGGGMGGGMKKFHLNNVTKKIEEK